MLKNSKFLLGVMVVAILFMGAFTLVTTKANAEAQAIVTVADIQYAATVKLGSSGQAALIWQRFLNGYSTTAQLVEDGAFGPLSSVQAKAWQASKGLVADGVMGALSRAAAMAQIASGTPASAFPAGCTSTVGYSSVTGLSCAPVALPAGCVAGAAYSSTTGLACTAVVMTLPAGCSTTAGYSSTTGASCSGGTTSTGPLVGGAGSITVTSTSSDVESTATENKDDVKVLGFKLEANDSDISLTNVKVYLKNIAYLSSTPDSSEKLTDYLDTVKVLMGTTVVGTADASDFSRESGSPDIFSKSIALSGAVVRDGDRNTFYVAVSSGSVDSDDLGAQWNVKVGEVRFEDATGVIMSDDVSTDVDTGVTPWNGTGAETFSYESSSANDNLTIKSWSSQDPNATTVTVDANSNTNGVLIGAFKLEVAEDSSDITLNELPVIITFANQSLSTGDDFADSIINTLNVKIDGTTYEADLATADDATTDTGNGGAATYRVDLSDSDVVINAGDTVDVEISADFNDQSGNYADLTTVTASVPDNTIDAEGADTLGDSERDGSYSGEAQTLSLTGGSVDVTNITESGNSNDTDDSYEEGTFTFYVTIAAENGNVDVDAASIVETLLDPAANGVAIGNPQIVNLDGDATENTAGTDYTVVDGDSNTFSLVYTLNPDAAGTYYVRLDSIDGISVNETTEGVNLVAA